MGVAAKERWPSLGTSANLAEPRRLSPGRGGAALSGRRDQPFRVCVCGVVTGVGGEGESGGTQDSGGQVGQR